MKPKLHFILIICLLIGLNFPLKGQWEPYGRPTNEAINRMFYISDSNIWAVGNAGLILHYNGAQWQKVNLPFLYEGNLIALHFVDANHGYLISEGGDMLKYTDGNWTFMNTSAYNISDIYIGSNHKGWLAGSNLYFFDGTTATNYPLPGGNAYLSDLFFKNDSTGWGIGYRYSDYKPVIYKYNGSNWLIDTVLSNGFLRNIYMLSNGTGWVTSDEGIAYYYDGTKWNKQIIDSSNYASSLGNVLFTDANHGWMISSNDYSYFTYENGIWTKNYSPSPFTDIIAAGSDILASSYDGNIYHYDQSQWVPLFNNYSGLLNIRMVDTQHIWIVSYQGLYRYRNGVLQTDTLINDYLSDAFFIDTTCGFAVGYNNYWKYKNGKWQKFSFDPQLGYPTLTSTYFLDSTLGWAVGYNGVILKYQNGTWTKEKSPTNVSLNSVWFTSPNNGWIVGEKGTILQYTSGKWTVVPQLTNNSLTCVSFSDPQNGWAVGNNQTILQYKNQKWQLYSSTSYGNYYRRVIHTNGKWYIVGSGGTILQWNDSIWENLPATSYQDFRSIAFIDSLNGILISYNGIYTTHTGGLPPYSNQSAIELRGTFNHSLILDNDTIKILSNVTIAGMLQLKKNVKVVEFEGPYAVNVNSFSAAGAPDNPIKFKLADSILSGSKTPWQYIRIYSNDANSQSLVKNCNFSNAYNALIISRGKLIVENCSFDSCQTAIEASSLTEGSIKNCTFTNNSYASVNLYQCNKITFENNYFTKQPSYAIYSYGSSNIVINKNTFVKNKGNTILGFENSDVSLLLSRICNNEGGIMVNNGKLIINNCLIANNNYSSYFDASTSQFVRGCIITNNAQIDILNSTIVNNKFKFTGNYKGAAVVYRFSNGSVYNTILWNNLIYDNDSSSFQPYQIFLYNNTSRPNFYYSNIQGGLNYFKKNPGVNFYGQYVNNHSSDPAFIQPTIGAGNDSIDGYDALQANWQLTENSPNINTGTLNIGLLSLPSVDLNNTKRVLNGVVDIGAYENKVKPIEITACDTIKTNTFWATDTVRIKNCNLVIAPTGKLSIKPGTRVEFWGPYKIIVQGSINAVGNADEPVIFAVNDTSNFRTSNLGGWKGIEFDNSTGVLDDKDSSIFKYCIFSYAKDTAGYYYQGMGMSGIIKAKYFSKLSITLSKFENNIAPFDTTYYTTAALINISYAKTVKIDQNVFSNNTGCIIKAENAGVYLNNNQIAHNSCMNLQSILYMTNSEAVITKNFITNNNTGNYNYQGLIYFNNCNSWFTNNVVVNNLDTGGYYSRYLLTAYGGKMNFHANTFANNSGFSYFNSLLLKAQNNILWDERFEAYGVNQGSLIQNNIIKNASWYSYYPYFGNNLDKDPLFIAPTTKLGIYGNGLSANWQLSYYSPAINAGLSDTSGLSLPKTDIIGNKRINGDAMDMGAYEHKGSKVQFLVNPVGGNYCSGDSIALICRVSNEAALQWQKDGVDIPNANDTILILSNLTELNSGNYVCRASNAYGSNYTTPAFIQVAIAPEILSQPTTQWLKENENDVISVMASGTKPLKYYWYFRNNLIDSTTIGKLSIANASVNNEGIYYCSISNYCGTVETQPFGVYLKPQICLVTADKETGKNVVVWERKYGRQIKGFNIYRESMVKDIYEKLGFVPYANPGVFVDSSSKPESRQYLYKIAAVSENDEVSPLSPYHKTLFLQYVSSIEGVNLLWQPYAIENGNVEFRSYVLYKGTDSTRLVPFDTVSSSITAYTDRDPQALTKLTFYRVAGLLYDACHSETLLKAGGGPFVEVLSNLEDNRLRSSGTRIDEVNMLPLSLYPQPASDYLKVAIQVPQSSTLRWEITDLTGSRIASSASTLYSKGMHTIQINVNNFAAGMYVLKIFTGNSVNARTFIIAR